MEEIGWGQFEMIIKINLKPPFQNSNIEMNHSLRFHPSKSSKQPFTFQSYDELILHNCPDEFFEKYEYLKNTSENRIMANPEIFSHESFDLIKQFNTDKKMDLKIHEEALTNAIEYVNEELKSMREKVIQTDSEIATIYAEVMSPLENRVSI
jgi:hypothetical protein